MEYYFGIDLHARDSYLCIIDEKDRIQLKEKMPNHLETIVGMLAATGQLMDVPFSS